MERGLSTSMFVGGRVNDRCHCDLPWFVCHAHAHLLDLCILFNKTGHQTGAHWKGAGRLFNQIMLRMDISLYLNIIDPLVQIAPVKSHLDPPPVQNVRLLIRKKQPQGRLFELEDPG